MKCSQIVFAVLVGCVGSALAMGNAALGRSDLSAILGIEPLPHSFSLDSQVFASLPDLGSDVGIADLGVTLDFQSSLPWAIPVEVSQADQGVESSSDAAVESASSSCDEEPVASESAPSEVATSSEVADDAASEPEEDAVAETAESEPVQPMPMSKYEYYMRYMGQPEQQPTEAPPAPSTVDVEQSAIAQAEAGVGASEYADDEAVSDCEYDNTYDDFVIAEPSPEATPADAADAADAQPSEIVSENAVASDASSECQAEPVAETASADACEESAFAKLYQRECEDGQPLDDLNASESYDYCTMFPHSRIASMGDLSARLPSELLSAADYALLKTLARCQDESLEYRRCMIEEHLATLGWNALQFISQFEATSGLDVGAFGDDLPMLAAILAGYRCHERGELTASEAVAMLCESTDNLPQTWIDAVQEIANEGLGVTPPSTRSEDPAVSGDATAATGLFRAAANTFKSPWQGLCELTAQSATILAAWKTDVLAEAARLRMR